MDGFLLNPWDMCGVRRAVAVCGVRCAVCDVRCAMCDVRCAMYELGKYSLKIAEIR
jgi:hypothetical protein